MTTNGFSDHPIAVWLCYDKAILPEIESYLYKLESGTLTIMNLTGVPILILPRLSSAFKLQSPFSISLSLAFFECYQPPFQLKDFALSRLAGHAKGVILDLTGDPAA